MNGQKNLKVPYIQGLDRVRDFNEFASKLEAAAGCGAGAGNIDTVNWPEDFPYQPECKFVAGWCKNGIGIMYSVRGLDLRAQALKDNGPVWEDSCCEFFISDPTDGTYYNFEMNCIGTLLAAKRKSREDCVHFSADKLKQVRRFSSNEHKAVEINDKEFSWKLGLFIPFKFIGVDKHNLPATLHANFYKCGDKTAHVHFLSWSPIGCPTPDFHRPDFFGTLELEPMPEPGGKKLVWPAIMSLYLITLGILCFGHFDGISEMPGTILGFASDKFVHFCMFLPFPILAYSTFCHKIQSRKKSVLAIVGFFIAGCLIGGGIELIQGLTDYRSCDIMDFRADATGLVIGSLITLFIYTIGHCKQK